jgi:hypothetical protein
MLTACNHQTPTKLIRRQPIRPANHLVIGPHGDHNAKKQ